MAPRKTTSSTTKRLSVAPWSSKAPGVEGAAGGVSGQGRKAKRGAKGKERAFDLKEAGGRGGAEGVKRPTHGSEDDGLVLGDDGDGIEDELEDELDEGGGDSASQIDLARMASEYQARRAAKAAQEREAFTASAKRPWEALIERVEEDFEKDEQKLNDLLGPFVAALEEAPVDHAAYLTTSHHRGEAEGTLGRKTEHVVDVHLARAERVLQANLHALEDRPDVLRKEKKRLLAQAQKRIKDELESQKLLADATSLIKSYALLFAHFRPPHPARGGSTLTLSTEGGSGKKTGAVVVGGGGRGKGGSGGRGLRG